jgi:hypothetical protein
MMFTLLLGRWRGRCSFFSLDGNPVEERLVRHPREWQRSSWSFYATGEDLLKMDPGGARGRNLKVSQGGSGCRGLRQFRGGAAEECDGSGSD